ncbi:MAG: hypothetical protein IKQ61_13260 [Spirochaetales bacterium]|nr:hypothetical protein [Spirochaetales bacterium]MBR6061751.1 hypothetical protein [Spirochaetales bacterium]MBR6201221.1 hypothetical protein [Spirochaetales bacterium]
MNRYNLSCTIVLLLTLCLLFGCKKKEEERTFNEVNDDIVYTDSFSPPDWERPVARRHVKSGDNQIGPFIADDVIDPRLRAIMKTISDFVKVNTTEDKDTLSSILTPAAYNSFVLRNADILIDEPYTLRVQLPDNARLRVFWLKFKIMFETTSLIGQVELNIDDNNKCLISDFDNQVFNQMKLRLMNKF